MKQITSSELIVGWIKLEANNQSQHGPHQEANNFYCVFSSKKPNKEIYWTFYISCGNSFE